MISALIVTHNAASDIDRCLDSLIATRASHEIEIVVVDNASEDDTVARVAARGDGIRVDALGENLGFGAANNRAAARANGDSLLLINADAWLAPDALGPMVETLGSDPRLGLVAPRLLNPDGSLQTTWAPTSGVIGEAIQRLRNRLEGRPFNHRLLPALLRPLTGAGWYSAACLLLRRSAFESVDGFDERYFLYFEDVDLCRRLLEAGWRMAQSRESTVFHRRGASRDPDRHEVRYRASQLAYYREARPRWEQRVLERKLRRRLRAMPRGGTRSALEALLEAPSPGSREPSPGPREDR